MSPIAVFAWIALAVFVVGCAVRAVRFAGAPLHLRWELYPVPHEAGKADYGGSYFEEVDWWTKERPHDNVGMVKYMLAEIFLQKGVHEHNKPLWWSTFVMHTGFYVLTAAVALVLLGGIAGRVSAAALADGAAIATALKILLTVLIALGSLMCLVGSVAILAKRASDRGMAAYTTFEHRFNLLFIAALGVVGLGVVARGAVAQLPQFASVMLGGDAGLEGLGPFVAAYVVLGGLFALYLPFTHMSHFISKYFAYHDVRWGDEPNLKDSRVEKKIKEQLAYRPTWAAPHMMADGQRTWVDIATSEVPSNDD